MVSKLELDTEFEQLSWRRGCFLCRIKNKTGFLTRTIYGADQVLSEYPCNFFNFFSKSDGRFEQLARRSVVCTIKSGDVSVPFGEKWPYLWSPSPGWGYPFGPESNTASPYIEIYKYMYMYNISNIYIHIYTLYDGKTNFLPGCGRGFGLSETVARWVFVKSKSTPGMNSSRGELPGSGALGPWERKIKDFSHETCH